MSKRVSDGSAWWVSDERTGSPMPPDVPGDVSDRMELRVGAKALVRDRNRVLLIKERRGDGSTFWTLPGGGVEPNESLSVCLRREMREEVQCRVTVDERAGHCVYRHTTQPKTTVYTVFDATLLSEPDPNPTEHVVDHAWLKPSELRPTTLDPIKRFVGRSVAATDEER